MGVIVKEIEVEGDKGRTTLRALFDTGASHSLVRRDKAEAITTLVPLARPLQFRLGNGQIGLEVREACLLFFEIKGYRYHFLFYATENLATDLIIGADAMRVWKIKPIPEEDDVQIDPSVLDLWLVNIRRTLRKWSKGFTRAELCCYGDEDLRKVQTPSERYARRRLKQLVAEVVSLAKDLCPDGKGFLDGVHVVERSFWQPKSTGKME